MKKQLLFLLLGASISFNVKAQISYLQQSTNYNATFINDGGIWNDVPNSAFNIWTSDTNSDNIMQVAAWKKFTDDGLTSGSPMTMAVGDKFTINFNTSKSWSGQIGVSLLSSPGATSSYADRHNNYAVQVNKNGNNPWEVVSSGGTIEATTITSGDLWFDYEFIFTLNTASTMTVKINKYTNSDHSAPLETTTKAVTLNNSNITGYAVYADNWLNGGFYFKQPTEYTVNTLSTNDFKKNSFSVFPNPANDMIQLKGIDFSDISEVSIVNVLGKKVFTSSNLKNNSIDITNLNTGMYILSISSENTQNRIKFIKK